MKLKNMTMILGVIAASMLASACSDEIEMRRPPKVELGDLPVIEGIHTYKAPLYWSVYEYCYDKERAGEHEIDLTPGQWDEYIDWVAENLKPYGYDMVCTDGFISMHSDGSTPYMTNYGSISLKDLVAKCKAKGLRLGVYDNPLWIHCADNMAIPGSEFTVGNLYYKGSDNVLNPSAGDQSFKWVVAEHAGAREYIDGFFKYYSELGVDYIRMDFLSWYEDGKDRNMGVVGYGYGRESYARALAYIAESAKKYGVFTSLVMPHLNNDAEIEAMYGNMVRIVSDTATGGWWHCSAQDKGKSYTNWPNCMNMFDGFTYWSHISGRDKVILDGDFIRLNTFDTDAERETVISLQLMAGGPVTPSDQPSTIGDNLRFYQNEELLALNADRFVGKPLSDNLNDDNNQIWYGSMSDGSYVVGIFNRNDNVRNVEVNFSDLGIAGEYNMRDLWKHVDEGKASSISVTLPAHGCKIVKLTK